MAGTQGLSANASGYPFCGTTCTFNPQSGFGGLHINLYLKFTQYNLLILLLGKGLHNNWGIRYSTYNFFLSSVIPPYLGGDGASEEGLEQNRALKLLSHMGEMH